MSLIPSICIPRISIDIDEIQITEIFEKILNKNCIKNINLILNKNKGNKRVLIDFNLCDDCPNKEVIINRLNSNNDFKIVYNKRDIWICYKKSI